MKRFVRCGIAVLVLLLALPGRTAFAAGPETGTVDWQVGSRVDLHVYGLSLHPDRDGTRRRNVANEFNPGLGLAYEFHNDARGAAFVVAGFYEDSGRNWARLAGPAYQFKLGDQWRVGGGLILMQSQTYNRGDAFVAPIPLVTYDFGMVKLNAIYAPRYRQYNQFAVFGLYLSIPLGP